MNANTGRPAFRALLSGVIAVVAVSLSYIAGAEGQDTVDAERSDGVAEAGRIAAEHSRYSESAAIETTQTDLHEGTSDWPSELEQHRYLCDSGLVLISAYDPEEDIMWVDYRSQVLALTSVRSGSGAKYGGKDVPWGWWSKGGEGLVFGYEGDVGDEKVLDKCSAIKRGGMTGAALEPLRRWSLELHSDYIALLDCVDCGDDIGAVLECRGQGKPARLSIFWAAIDTDDVLDNAALTLEVGGEMFERPAETTYAGQIGQFPQIRIGPDDPLIAALKAGEALQVSFAGLETSIGLNGFGAALAEFDRACPWHHDQAASGTVGGLSAGGNPASTGDPASGELRWMLNEYSETDSEVSMMGLSFGIPETDAIAFQATCTPGAPEALINAVAVLDVHERVEAEAAELVIATADLELRVTGQVSTGGATHPGILVSVGPRHPLWSILQRDELVSLSGGEGPDVSLPVTASSDVIAGFLQSCSEQ